MEKFSELLEQKITPRVVALFFFGVYLISLIPMFVIGFYNYPAADDYSIGSNARQAFVASHSVIQAIWAAMVRAAEDWMVWMGYFTSNFFMALPPSVFGERWYAMTTIIMVGSISLSTGYFLYQLFVKVLKAEKNISKAVIYILLFFTMQCMVGRVEAFYWYCGAANYMLTHSLLLCFYGMLISLMVKKHKKSFVLFTCLVGFFAGGGNQMSALNGAIISGIFLVYLIVTYKKTKRGGMIIPLFSFYLGFLLNIVAPGNWVRSEISSGMNPIKAILVSLLYGVDYCLSQWTDWSILLMMIMLIPFLWKVVQKTEFKFSYPVPVILFAFSLVSAMMTPPLFAVSNLLAARLQAVTFTMYLLILVLAEGYAIGWMQKKYFMKKPETEQEKIKADTIIFVCSCMLFFGAAATLVVMENPHYYTSSSAMTDLINGSAKQYGDILKRRAQLYNSGEKDLVVEPLTVYPQLLYFSDITEDTEDWQNRGLCRFYGLNSVRKESWQE